ncbi:hypothetical protein [Deinococcus aquatilis]|uniref:hypothetical protein n=1 Tax=Deinococcus aquatilis TaxID=519440 RepID=UPI0012FBA83F|nr:hypothetical protein [Deinococcus aquatilis]
MIEDIIDRWAFGSGEMATDLQSLLFSEVGFQSNSAARCRPCRIKEAVQISRVKGRDCRTDANEHGIPLLYALRLLLC